MRIKVCGITNLEDALLTYQAGAHALGFIFASESPRFLTPEQCQKITLNLPPFCERVGVFVDEKPERILEIAHECNLSAIQLHGKSEDNNYIKELKRQTFLPIVRAFRLKSLSDCEQIKELDQSLLQALLIDGQGKVLVDKEIVQKVHQLSKLPIVLAGALNHENITEVLAEVKPQAIDICSGLEREPGKKDPEKIRSFFERVKV